MTFNGRSIVVMGIGVVFGGTVSTVGHATGLPGWALWALVLLPSLAFMAGTWWGISETKRDLAPTINRLTDLADDLLKRRAQEEKS
jgi:hypothetical protein